MEGRAARAFKVNERGCWGRDAQIDPAQQATVLSTYVKAGVLTINEARAQMGLAPLADPAANVAMTLTASGYQPIGGAAGVPRPEPVEGRRSAADLAGIHKFNPYHVPPGNGSASGQFASGDGGSGNGVVLASDIVTPRGYTVQHLPGPNPLDPQGLNAPISADEQQKIANALNLLVNGGGAVLHPHPFQNLPHKVTGAVMPPSTEGYTAYDVPGLGVDRGEGRLLVDKGTGAIYYTHNHYRSFYRIQLNPGTE